MVSVVLDGAFALRAAGKLQQGRQQVAISWELFERLAIRLLEFLRAMEEHGRHFGTLPPVAPLDPGNFRGDTAQRLASRSALLHRFLLSSRSRFFHKLHTLVETVEHLSAEFVEAAEEIAQGLSVQPAEDWKALDDLHYDLNTSLRETSIVLKAFLGLLPAAKLQSFHQKSRPAAKPAPQSDRGRVFALYPRRAVTFQGQ